MQRIEVNVSTGEQRIIELTAEEITAMPVPTHAELVEKVLAEIRTFRATMFTLVDVMQLSALATGNDADALAIENFKAGSRNITLTDLSAATTEAEMRILMLTAYKALTAAAPASVQLAFRNALQTAAQ